MSALSFSSLQFQYPSGGGIEATDLRFPAGQLSIILGPNGAGKSSLIKALAGVIPAQIDSLSLGTTPILQGPQRARQIAYLSQTRIGPSLAPVRDVVSLGRYPFGGQDDAGHVGRVMAELSLTDISERPYGQLSGGEQARVLLGRALAVDAPILLADEPTAALDPYYAIKIMMALKEEAQRGRIVVASLHDLTLAKRFADHILIINEGQISGQGDWDEAMTPERLKSVFRVRLTEDGDLQPL